MDLPQEDKYCYLRNFFPERVCAARPLLYLLSMSGRKNLLRRKPYGPIASHESSEEYDLPSHMHSLLESYWRKLRYQLPAFALREGDEGK